MPYRILFFEDVVKLLARYVVPIGAKVVHGEGALNVMALSPRRRASVIALSSGFHDFAHLCAVSVMVAVFTSTVPYLLVAAAFLMLVAISVKVIALEMAAIWVAFEETAS